MESAFDVNLESGGRFCVGAFRRNLFSVAVNSFSNVIYFVKKCNKFCTFDAICKYIAAINCITSQRKKCKFPSKLTGMTTLVS